MARGNPVRGRWAWFGVAALLAGQAMADDRAIAPSDVLGLRVTDWQPIDGELREWTAITGSYVVGANGKVAIPHVGEIDVLGQSPSAVSAAIGAALQQQFALADRPDASVTIETRQGILVGGAVEQPGEVPFVSAMTARHAIALAGGLMRPSGGEGSVLLQSLTAEAQVRILDEKVAAGALRVARLRAELDDATAIAVSDAPMMDTATLATLRADADRLLTLNRERLRRELELVDSRITLLQEEIEALEAKQTALDRQKALAEEQRAATESLADRGLAANARLLDAERALVTIETQVLDVATALLEARQDVEVAKAERLQLVEGRAADLMLELQAAEVELAELRSRLELQRSVASLLAATLGGEVEPTDMSITIYRGGTVVEDSARSGLDTPLLPGDFVEVTLMPAPVAGGG